MAIPTQFSVTSTRRSPIANPESPKDLPRVIDAENKSIVEGANILASLSSAGVDNPDNITAQPSVSVDTSVTIPALSAGGVDVPINVSAQTQTSIGTPDALNALSVQEVDAPPFTIVDRIQYNFISSTNDWTANNATLTTGADALTATMTGADLQLLKTGFTEGARAENILWIRIKCTTSTLSTTISAFTSNSKHGFSGDYKASSDAITLQQGLYSDVYINLAEIPDYARDGLTSLRIDPHEGSLQTFEIDFIILGRYQGEVVARDSESVEAPSAVSAEAQATTPAPSIVTPNAGTAITPPFPLRNPRILYDNALLSYDSIASSEGVPVNAIAPNTWQKWEFDSTSTTSAILVRLPEAVTMDAICIGAHNLGSIASTISITYSTDGVAFVDWAPDFSVSEDTAIMSYIETPRQVKAIQITILSGVEGLGVIGYISAGEALQMQRPIFNGHTPITDADVTEYYANRTESGEIINQDIRRMGYQSSADFSNLDDTWYRTYFAPFKQSAKKLPYFFAWNLDEYPQDVGLCRASSDMSAPMQNGTRTKRSVSIPLLGAG